MQIYFLSLEDVLEIHQDQINRYGGKKGVRDQNLLLIHKQPQESVFAGVGSH